MTQELRRSSGYLTALILCATYYCQRVFGFFIPYEGDALPNLYFRIYERLLTQDYNPHQWHFMSNMSFSGRSNPFLIAISFLLKTSFPHLPDTSRGLLTCLITSWLLLWLLSWSSFFCLRYFRLSRMASFLGAIVISYTGFHLCGVREFNHMFLVSFIFIFPTLIGFCELCKTKNKLRPALAIALCMGLSYLGGTNAPMFYFMPFFFCIPFLYPKCDRIKSLTYLCFAGLVSLLVGSSVLFPGMRALPEMNRSELHFIGSGFSFIDKFITLFLRDWWRTEGWSFHETDCFLGLPILCLLLIGFVVAWRQRKQLWHAKLMALFLVAAVLISNKSNLPPWIGWPMEWVYERLSISNPDRFFLLATLPAAWFVGLAWDHGFFKFRSYCITFLALLQCFLITRVFLPVVPQILPDMLPVATASLVCGMLATLGILFLKANSKPIFKHSLLFLIFAMYALAPIQVTLYSLDARYLWELPKNIEPRLRWKNILGWVWNYDKAFQRLERHFSLTPEFLKEDWTRQGKVLMSSDLVFEFVQRGNYFAPKSGHQFAFTQIFDPATPKRLFELSKRVTPAILDLYGVCSFVPFEKVGPPFPLPAVQRPSCLPEAFGINQLRFSNSDSHVLAQMQGSSTTDFQKKILVNCSDLNCQSLQQGTAKTTKVERTSPNALPLQYTVETDGPTWIFFSLPYHRNWRAELGNHPLPLIRANHAFTAIWVPAGKSTLHLYLDQSFRTWCDWISILSIIGLACALIPYLTQTSLATALPSMRRNPAV